MDSTANRGTESAPEDDVLSATELEDQAALELPARRAMSLLGGTALSGGGLLGGATPTSSPTALPAASTPDATSTAADSSTLAHQVGTPPPDAATPRRNRTALARRVARVRNRTLAATT